MLQKLNLSEEALEEKVALEVDDLLWKFQADRQLARLLTGVPRVLTKKDCLTLFRATGIPTSGALWGVYRWVADLGVARFNFDMDIDQENTALLDAYD